MIAALFLAAAFAVPPTPTHYVTDTAHVVSATTQTSLEAKLHAFEVKTGDQVIVWIGTTTGSIPLEEWTAQVGESWGIGHKGKDNGAVLFIFMNDHKVRIEVGYGLEPVLTDAQSAHIINDDILPDMRRNDTDAAVTDGVNGILAVLAPAGSATPAQQQQQQPSSNEGGGGEALAALLLFGIFGLVLFSAIVTTIRHGKRHGDWLDSFMISGAAGFGSGWMGGVGFGGGGLGGGGGFGGFSAGGGGFGGGGASGGW